MPLFQYQAVDVRGASQVGEIECATRAAALELLQQRGLTPLSMAEPGSAKPASFGRALQRFRGRRNAGRSSATEIVSLTQSLAALLNAGLTIDRALGITVSLNAKSTSSHALADIAKTVREGRSFAEALNASSLALPPYYIGMIQAGEVGGSLAHTMTRLAELIRKQQEIRERIHSALVYPLLLAAVVLITVVLLLTFVLPRFEALFAESEAPLPLATRAVLATGAFVSAYWWIISLALAAVGFGLHAYGRTPAGRHRRDRWLLRSRWTFGLPLSIETGRLLRTLGTLLANGVQIGSAMRVARATLGNTVLQKALDEAARRVKAGESTSSALNATAVFPAHAIQLARVGEETGRLEALLLEAATILENESGTKLERLLAVAVPGLTVVMGALIATLIGSVLVGLLSVNELAF